MQLKTLLKLIWNNTFIIIIIILIHVAILIVSYSIHYILGIIITVTYALAILITPILIYFIPEKVKRYDVKDKKTIFI